MPEVRYAGGQLDRAAALRKDPGWVASMRAHPGALVVPVWRDKNLVLGVASDSTAPRAARCTIDPRHPILAMDGALPWAFLGLEGDVPVFAVDLSEVDGDPVAALGADGAFVDLRQVGALMSAGDAALLAYARGLLGWQRRHPYCSVCGAATEAREGGHVRQCRNPRCRAETFPRTDPAVIMLVEHRPANGGPRRCLLGRHHRLPPRAFSTLAGYVEPGESLEDAVVREVWEETGVRVSRVAYHASQPWPFPSSLMVGFLAVAESDALTIDREELEEARWFTAAELATFGEWGDESAQFQLPRRDSIARVLIDAWRGQEPAARG